MISIITAGIRRAYKQKCRVDRAQRTKTNEEVL